VRVWHIARNVQVFVSICHCSPCFTPPSLHSHLPGFQTNLEGFKRRRSNLGLKKQQKMNAFSSGSTYWSLGLCSILKVQPCCSGATCTFRKGGKSSGRREVLRSLLLRLQLCLLFVLHKYIDKPWSKTKFFNKITLFSSLGHKSNCSTKTLSFLLLLCLLFNKIGGKGRTGSA
jgi:hypothetical protein